MFGKVLQTLKSAKKKVKLLLTASPSINQFFCHGWTVYRQCKTKIFLATDGHGLTRMCAELILFDYWAVRGNYDLLIHNQASQFKSVSIRVNPWLTSQIFLERLEEIPGRNPLRLQSRDR